MSKSMVVKLNKWLNVSRVQRTKLITFSRYTVKRKYEATGNAKTDGATQVGAALATSSAIASEIGTSAAMASLAWPPTIPANATPSVHQLTSDALLTLANSSLLSLGIKATSGCLFCKDHNVSNTDYENVERVVLVVE